MSNNFYFFDSEKVKKINTTVYCSVKKFCRKSPKFAQIGELGGHFGTNW